MTSELIAEGAEAKIFLVSQDGGTFIRKERIQKTFRISEIDNDLRRRRTRREAKVLSKLPIAGPKLIKMDDKLMILDMEYIEGTKLRDHLTQENFSKIAEEIGGMLAKLHNEDIMHGDLTTSNMILRKNHIYFIDFGLSFFSSRIEDRAVDLHLLKEALTSTHHEFADEMFAAILASYSKEAKDVRDILKQLDQVELRGRYKHKS